MSREVLGWAFAQGASEREHCWSKAPDDGLATAACDVRRKHWPAVVFRKKPAPGRHCRRCASWHAPQLLAVKRRTTVSAWAEAPA